MLHNIPYFRPRSERAESDALQHFTPERKHSVISQITSRRPNQPSTCEYNPHAILTNRMPKCFFHLVYFAFRTIYVIFAKDKPHRTLKVGGLAQEANLQLPQKYMLTL